jgi:regulator of protease activity HflC (stomatin/prohibitin superfamily)
LPPQPVITRDNVTINVDSVVYWMITDPVKSVYEINDLVGSPRSAHDYRNALGNGRDGFSSHAVEPRPD